MSKPRTWIVTVTLGLTGLLLGDCAFVGQHYSAQYASLEPANKVSSNSVTDPGRRERVDKMPASSFGDRQPLQVSLAKAPPVVSLLEMRHRNVVIQKWDLSCGAAALATLLKYEFGESVTEKDIARGLMSRDEYIEHPNLVQIRQGFSLFDLKRYVQAHGYKGEGFGQLDFNDLLERAPIMIPVDALGYNHFVIFRGVMGNRVLLADPAWGNRTMTIEKFQRMWLDYGKPMGHVGFVVKRADGTKPVSRLQPKQSEFVMLH